MKRRHSLPPEVYTLVEQTPATVLLEGSRLARPETNRESPWTRLFTDPLCLCVAQEAEEIPALFAAIEQAVANGQTAAGFFSYECGACFEPKANIREGGAKTRAGENSPLAWFSIYARSYAFDHATGEFVGGAPPELDRFHADEQAVESAMRDPAPEPEITAEFTLTEAQYARRIAAIHEWIRAGDVYQLNFTAPFHVKAPGSVAAHYARLRLRQPVDFGAFIHWRQGRHILSFSPELFFRIDEIDGSRHITTRPMKGTAARGRTTREDLVIAEWLRNDPKNRSENVMIVDLLRNDLGRVARFGTVDTESLFAIERYPTLWQMTSTVSAELKPGVGFHDIFRALFPCGSITGAPKVRAMQLISELEDRPRGVYTGAIGFFSPRQAVFNVAIRTLDLNGGSGIMGAGSGIVIDSEPQEEFRECLLKARFLSGPAHRTTGFFVSQPDKLFLIETLLWNGAYPFLDMHLDRVTDSADYFGFACDRREVRAALLEHAATFADGGPLESPQMRRAPSLRLFSGVRVGGPEPEFSQVSRKVRMLLDADGSLHISDEILTAKSSGDLTPRVCISKQRTDPSDPTLYHKTTQRPIYASAYIQAAQKGYDDVLFINLHGEVTEGAISNVFIEKNGRWLTPPIECGLLAGVYRRHLLETRPDIEERVLYEPDLRAADAVYIANAVRGLRRVTIDWDSSDPA